MLSHFINAGFDEFHDAATMRRATITGLGVGLLSRNDALEDIANGKLVAPFGTDCLLDMPAEMVPGFYLIVPRAHKRVKTIAAFCDWITSENWTELLEAPGPMRDPSRRQ